MLLVKVVDARTGETIYGATIFVSPAASPVQWVGPIGYGLVLIPPFLPHLAMISHRGYKTKTVTLIHSGPPLIDERTIELEPAK